MLCRDLVYVCCLLVRFVGLEVEGGRGVGVILLSFLWCGVGLW